MTAMRSERVMTLAAAAFLLATGGCPNSEVIGTSTGAIELSILAQGGGGRYNEALVQIEQIALRPTDPDLQQSLGSNIGLLANPVDINLNVPDPVTFDIGAPPGLNAPLTEGTYEVVTLTVTQFTLRDDPPPDYGPVCVQMVDVLALPPNPTQPSLTEVRFQTPAILEISAAATAELRLTVDAPGLISMFEGRFICTETATCNGFPPPCLLSYNRPSTFLLEPYFVFQQL
jgi:hypothetical protein